MRKFACRLNYLDTRAVSDEQGRFKVPYIPTTAYTLVMQTYAYRGTDMKRAQFALNTERDLDEAPIEVRVVR